MTIRSIQILLATALLFMVAFFSSCNLIEGLIDDEDEKINIGLYLEKEEVFPMEVLIFWPENEFTQQSTYYATVGDVEVEAKLSNDNKFIILVPELPAGNYDLEIDLGEFQGSAGIFIRPLPENLDPEAVWESFITDARTTTAFLEELSQTTGIDIPAENLSFTQSLISELETVYEELSNEEKQYAAIFVQTNPDIFGQDKKAVLADNSEVLEAFKTYLTENKWQFLLSGSTFALSLTAPEPTGLTKFLAITAGIYLVKKMHDLGVRILDIYNKAVVTESASLTMSKTDFTVLNHEEVFFDVALTNRSLFKNDLNSQVILVSEVASLIEEITQAIETINGYIISFRQRFNLGQGGLANIPQRISQKNEFTRETVPGNGSLVEIEVLDNTAVNPVIILKGDTYIHVKFSTCEDDYQYFTFRYSYDKTNFNIQTDYEALLIATPIIYNEFTDPRDGYTYKTIQIGDQEWFAENLRYNGPDDSSICPVHQEANCSIYGRLYDVEDAVNACPPGWHLPDDDEWKQLEAFLGMPHDQLDNWYERGSAQFIGDMLKSCDGWPHGEPGTNATGFSALPAGGHRYPYGGDNVSLGFERRGTFWTSSRTDSGNEYPNRIIRQLDDHSKGIIRDTDMWHHYYAVRCVKN